MNVNRIAARNVGIVLAIAALAVLSGSIFGSVADGLTLIIMVLFLFAIAAFAYNYFRQNELAWLVLSDRQKKILIGAGIGIALLVILGFPLLSPYITPLGVIALIAVLVLVIIWVIRESRRFR